MVGRLLKGASAGNKQVIRYQIMGSQEDRRQPDKEWASENEKVLVFVTHASSEFLKLCVVQLGF